MLRAGKLLLITGISLMLSVGAFAQASSNGMMTLMRQLMVAFLC